MLRTYPEAVRYPPNQTYIGNLSPQDLASLSLPWHNFQEKQDNKELHHGPFGPILPQEFFYNVLKSADVLTPPLIDLSAEYQTELSSEIAGHPVLSDFAATEFISKRTVQQDIENDAALALLSGDKLLGCIRRDNRAEGKEDDNLDAVMLLEALSVKASGAIALKWLLHREGLAAEAVDFVISCGEEAVGDRYQRGGGGMAKAIAEMCGCSNASGMDVKNFCAGPGSALVTASAFVKTGLYRNVVVVAGGSLAKLGMKFQAMLAAEMPILGDSLGAFAILVSIDDGFSPVIHIEPGSIGTAKIGASTSDETIYRQLILEPLYRLGLTMQDIDKFAPELHNPEIMVQSGSGDVAQKNYRMIAAMAVLAGEIDKAEMTDFIERIGMIGFAPPQGHIPSAIPYLGHALKAMRDGNVRRVMFLCKASLFLSRLTNLYDGVSFVVEANPNAGK
jgi:betaine reductase